MANIAQFPGADRTNTQKARLWRGLLREGNAAIIEATEVLQIPINTDAAVDLGVWVVRADAGQTATALAWAEDRFGWLNRRFCA